MDSFQRYHVAVNLIYFVVLIANTFLFMNPVLIFINLICLLFYYSYLRKVSSSWKLMKISLLFACTAVIGNTLLNHQGATIVAYFLKRPITYESILFGVMSAFFLFSMIFLFHLFQIVMSAEKCTVLFGRTVPKFAMVFSMGLRLIPKLTREYEQIKRANKMFAKGKKMSSLKYISVLIGTSLEDSIDTADSMAARGYLLKGRKTHRSEPFSRRDGRIVLLFAVLIVIMVIFHDRLSAIYFPEVILPPFSLKNIIYYTAYVIFINVPMILNGKEHIRWYRIQSLYFK